jgi:hypothetical protein
MPPSSGNPKKFPNASLFIDWKFGTLLVMANTALASAYVFYIMQELTKGVMNNFGNRTMDFFDIKMGFYQ